MNCVTCEKCRVYGKLQTLALATALRILLEPNTEVALKALQRNEIIALIVTLRQFSNSIKWMDQFDLLLNGENMDNQTCLKDDFSSNFLNFLEIFKKFSGIRNDGIILFILVMILLLILFVVVKTEYILKGSKTKTRTKKNAKKSM